MFFVHLSLGSQRTQRNNNTHNINKRSRHLVCTYVLFAQNDLLPATILFCLEKEKWQEKDEVSFSNINFPI